MNRSSVSAVLSIAALTLLSTVTPAAAQSTYVGAALVGDIFRATRVELDGTESRTTASLPDGESLGFNVRVGRRLGPSWGVELEFARSGELEQRLRQPFSSSRVIRDLPVGVLIPENITLPPVEVEIDTEQRHTSVAALGWFRQRLGNHVDLSYLGGIVFNRVVTEQDFDLTSDRLALWRPLLPDSVSTEHGIGAAVGLDAGFRVAEGTAITAGLRMQSVSIGGRDAWRVRPNVGVRIDF